MRTAERARFWSTLGSTTGFTRASEVNGDECCTDNRAFEILVNRYKARILSLAFRITRNHEDAQDVTQQSFQNAFVHLQKFQGKSSFPTWLTRIAINEALMCLRKNRVSRAVSLEEVNLE